MLYKYILTCLLARTGNQVLTETNDTNRYNQCPSAFLEGEEKPQGAAFDINGKKEALKLPHGRGSSRNAMKKINAQVSEAIESISQ